ncbi:MAG: hypothetical protein Q9195_004841 [Heterodermia aff. obscurata]
MDSSKVVNIVLYFCTASKLGTKRADFCSSHSHVEVDKFFQDEGQNSSIVAIENVNAKRTREALSAYINGEIQRRGAHAGNSAFYDSNYQHLRNELTDTLLNNARGVFQMAIKSDTDARKLLIRLKEDSRESMTDDDLLTKKYQRLWDIICSRKHSNFIQRAQLFHFVLATNQSPTIQMLFTVLRVRNDNFDRFPHPEEVMGLCFNFLVLNDKTKSVEFAHSSTKNFIRNLNMKQSKLAKGNEERFFSDYRNHESIAKLYMNLWNNYFSDSSEKREIKKYFGDIRTEKHASCGILVSYFTIHELTHFPKAARKRSLDDPVWRDFKQRLVLPSDSAFGVFLLNNADNWFGHYNIPRERKHSKSCLHSEGGRLKILPSHILACLPVFDEYDGVSSISTRDTAGAHDCVKLLKDMCTLRGNFEDYVIAKNLSFRMSREPEHAHALHLACSFENAGAVRAILNAAKLLSPNALSEMLRSNTQSYSFPLFITIELRNVTIASILLKADRQPVTENAETSGAEGLSTYTSSQWNLKQKNLRYKDFKHKEILKYEPILMKAAHDLKEEDVLTLLKVARPENINTKDENGDTLLHYAVRDGKNVLTRDLVQIYGADKTATNMNGRTPFELETRDEDSVLSDHS